MPGPKLRIVSTSLFKSEAGEQTDSAPQHHHQGQNLLETIALNEKLDRKFSGQEADELDRSTLLKRSAAGFL